MTTLGISLSNSGGSRDLPGDRGKTGNLERLGTQIATLTSTDI